MIPESHKLAALEFWRRGRVRTPLVLEGDCMAPMLNDGDEIVIAHGDDRPRFGDVVAFRRDGRILVQRAIGSCVAQGRTVYEVKPDAHGLCALRVAPEDLVGRVVEVRSAGGRWDLESAPWRLANLVMGCRSLVAVRRRSGASPLWRTVSWLFRLRKRLVPWADPLGLLPLRLIRRLAPGRPVPARGRSPRGVAE